ncbi:acylphosphatase [Clostridium chromiireducens]|uniref:Acylphosphatase n=1 Tax=Clostridium chromiireducens TaxID=225345 RepID=A0A399IT30_9CLOT|nr:acylphosphatase [Clostridium chromiireducens]MVX62554.1 acylphosphatase [Clostridium chromiireducens]RII36153.1 acylphosphatase [Clostridium chromiireducens]
MIRYSITVSGRVQGVGFRYFVQLTACRLNLTGWCKNLMDGNVQIEVQGIEKDINSFISAIKVGNNFSRVDDINLSSLPLIPDEKKFKIKY